LRCGWIRSAILRARAKKFVFQSASLSERLAQSRFCFLKCVDEIHFHPANVPLRAENPAVTTVSNRNHGNWVFTRLSPASEPL
jgi:hypothetical protein